jgi:hypothetical protein
MLRRPNAIINGYRNCLVFESLIKRVQQTLYMAISTVAAQLGATFATTKVAVFGIEFHGPKYNKHVERYDSERASLRVWVNEVFAARSEGNLLDSAKKLWPNSVVETSFSAEDLARLVREEFKQFEPNGGKLKLPALQGVRCIAFGNDTVKGGRQRRPQLKLGFDLVKIIRKLAHDNCSYAIGLTVSTAATDARGVVNKCSENDLCLTEQMLPGAVDHASLLQSLRVSGCQKGTIPLRGRPVVWATKSERDRLQRAVKVVEEMIEVKKKYRGKSLGLLEAVAKEADEGSGAASLEWVRKAAEARDQIVASRRGKAVATEVLQRLPTADVLDRLVSKARRDGAKALLREQWNEFASPEKPNLEILKDVEVALQGIDEPDHNDALEALKQLKTYLRDEVRKSKNNTGNRDKKAAAGNIHTMEGPAKKPRQ